MSDVFGSLAARAVGRAAAIVPRVSSRYEPAGPPAPIDLGAGRAVAALPRVDAPTDMERAPGAGVASQDAAAWGAADAFGAKWETEPSPAVDERYDAFGDEPPVTIVADERERRAQPEAFEVREERAVPSSPSSPSSSLSTTSSSLSPTSSVSPLSPSLSSSSPASAFPAPETSGSSSIKEDVAGVARAQMRLSEAAGDHDRAVSRVRQRDESDRAAGAAAPMPAGGEAPHRSQPSDAPRTASARDALAEALEERRGLAWDAVGESLQAENAREAEGGVLASEAFEDGSAGADGVRARRTVRQPEPSATVSRAPGHEERSDPFAGVFLRDAGSRWATPEAGETGTTSAEPIVHVHIGRVDVRMTPPPAAPQRPRRAPAEPKLPLDAYLRNRGRPAS